MRKVRLNNVCSPHTLRTQVGFCDAVEEPTAQARNREELLELVFKAYAQLWDEALGVSVPDCSKGVVAHYVVGQTAVWLL
jgi:hypothetical protein